ncbi:glycosyltransferase family 39 protein [Pseudodesulfovibrio sp. zrk46]|uniref:ArnT family glycosyltransferase n=1 Tax=Pseudodesulfovibrio sp. zrk46 TaxID=2725288 RepID=UPI0014493BE1|nr:glycosyltransferase family 39 protein [Pseudodesulfovibrio sp. zrk46]QJB55137.1 phospholipid carrier-dependent glycosyltransferase [Pseudodesulfovibrio sp. zrk46]
MKQTAQRIWYFLEDHPWLTMIFGVFAQTWFTLSNRALWFSDEVRYANAYQNLVQHGKWMVLALNGQPYPDKPPIYFWFLWLLDVLTPADMPTVFFLGAALSGLFLLMASYKLARTLGFDRTVSLGGVLVLLSSFLLAGLFHYSRMDLMFAALIVLSHACFFKAFSMENQGKYPLYGFLLAGVATLVKGPLGFIFPLLTCAVFLLWKGEIRRFFTKQMGLGFLAMIGILLLWIGGVMLAEGPSFLIDTVLGKHVIQRATKTFHHREPFHYYLVAFPLAWLPWTLFAFVAPVKKAFSLEHWGGLWASRREAGPRAFLWIMFAATFIFLSSLSGKVLIYILPMFPPLAFLMVDAMTTLDQARTKRFWTIVAGLWCVLGGALLVVGDLLPFDVPLRGLGIAAAVMIGSGGLIFLSRTAGFRASILASVLAVTAWLYPVGLMVAPSMDNAMSPKRQALIIGELADDGFTPMAYRVYSGIFTYYANHNQLETSEWDELNALFNSTDKPVLSIRDKHWNSWEKNGRPDDVRIIDRQTIAGMVYYLVVRK